MQKGLDETYLVNKVLSGSRESFVQLIRQYEGLVLHIVTPLVGVNEDREDICQDIFMKVFEKLDTFQFKSKLGTWIGNIAYNTSINYLQKKKNILLSSIVSPENESSFLESKNVESHNPEEIIIREEDIGQLSAAVDKLREFQKTVLLLFYQDEMSIDEISKMIFAFIVYLGKSDLKGQKFKAREK